MADLIHTIEKRIRFEFRFSNDEKKRSFHKILENRWKTVRFIFAFPKLGRFELEIR